MLSPKNSVASIPPRLGKLSKKQANVFTSKFFSITDTVNSKCAYR